MINLKALRDFLARVVMQYEKSAPTVSRWADDLYIRVGEDIRSIQLVELLQAQALLENGQWEQPNYAANRIYKLMDSLGQDVTGHAGF